MKSRLQLKVAPKVKTSQRLIYGGTVLAVAILSGIGLFMFGNLGVSKKSKASVIHRLERNSSKDFELTNNLDVFTEYKAESIILKWSQDVNPIANNLTGAIILKQSGCIAGEMPELITPTLLNSAKIDNWKVLYNGTNSGSFSDKSKKGIFTYLIFLSDAQGNYSVSARLLVLNGTEQTATIAETTTLNGLTLAAGNTLIIAPNAALTLKCTDDIIINGKIIDRGKIINYTGGEIKFTNGSTYELNRDGGEIINADWEEASSCIITGFSIHAPSGTDQTFGNFIWNNPAQKKHVTLSRSFNTTGDFTVLNTGDKKLTFPASHFINGNFIQKGGTLNLSKSTISFNGVTAQIIDINALANNFTIGNNKGVILNANTTITGNLKFISGKIYTGNYEIFVDNNSSNSITGFSDTKYISGKLRRTVSNNGTYDFPVGSDKLYELATVSLYKARGFDNMLASYSTALCGTYPDNNAWAGTTPINKLLNGGFWSINSNTPMIHGRFDMTLKETGYTESAIAANYYGIVMRADSTKKWISPGINNRSTQLEINGTVTAVRTAMNAGFGDFAIGYGNTILPAKLNSIKALMSKNKVVHLNWSTEAEEGNEYFYIQRSADGNNFEELGLVKGGGTSIIPLHYSFTDPAPLENTSYYRIKQPDSKGKYVYSEIAAVTNDKLEQEKINEIATQNSITVFPNPFTDALAITFSSDKDELQHLQILNINGALIYSETVDVHHGNANFYQFNDQKALAPGMYLIQIVGKNSISATVKIIKQ